MNIKKEAYQQIVNNIQKQVSDIDFELERNKYEFKNLAYKQTVLKRRKVELIKLRSIVIKDSEVTNE